MPSLNWSHAENCSSDPQPETGVCTFMGTLKTGLPGEDKSTSEARVARIKTALDMMRKHGYRCQLPPKGWTSVLLNSEPKKDPKEEEIRFLEENCRPIEVLDKASDAVVFVVAHNVGWVYIRCNTQEAEEFVDDYLWALKHYEFGLVRHEEKRRLVNSSRGISLVSCTGGTGSSVGTLFELQDGSGKTIAKALCAYRNAEMGNPGPTIELFEVFRGFRRKGFGKLLLEHVTEFFELIFCDEQDFAEPVNFNVCNCTNSHAAMWFMRQGFQNWDGMGEELGKYLGY
ncbi:unnamed protein product [Cylindrotheca closterium]|uniref:Uncharacterized protein n=1 Tax=Cylindrotheca closterium TaxID=2856 RepID=A0AAD2FK24_9STRA|nr:unnamed protein product [Cylindrotheca closterium]